MFLGSRYQSVRIKHILGQTTHKDIGQLMWASSRSNGGISEPRPVEVGRDILLGSNRTDSFGRILREDDPTRAVMGVLNIELRGRSKGVPANRNFPVLAWSPNGDHAAIRVNSRVESEGG